MNFDDQPIKPMKQEINEFADMDNLMNIDENQEIKEEENKPLEQRINSKFVVIRKKSLSEIYEKIKLFTSPVDPIFIEDFKLYSNCIEDKHAQIQEISLDILNFVFEKYENAHELISEIFCKVVEKCYSSSKNSLNQKAKTFLVNAFQISTDSKGFFDGLKVLLESKTPKIPQITLNLITHILSLFGSFNIDYRGVLPLVEKLSENANIPLKKEIIEFYKELYKWIRGAIKSSSTKLKEMYQSIPKPIKFLKNKNKFNNENSTNIKNDHNLNSKNDELFDDSEEVEIFNKKYCDTWAESLLAEEKKWIEKKEMLDDFIKDTNKIKIKKSSQRHHIIGTFQKLLKDSNVNVVNGVILSINNMILGLRKDFTECKEFLIPLIEKFKDKKEKIYKDTLFCLENMFIYSISIDEIFDEMKEYILKGDKPPIVKERFCLLLEKILIKTFSKDLKKICKPLSEFLFKLSDDASGEVRNVSLKILGLIKAKIGEMSISKVLNEINNIKKKKIDEAAENIILDPIYDHEIVNKNTNNNLNEKNTLNKNLSTNNFKTNNFNIDNVDMDIDTIIIPVKSSNNFKHRDIEMKNEKENLNNSQVNNNQINVIVNQTSKIAIQKSSSVNPKKDGNNINKNNNKPKDGKKPEDNIDLELEEDENLNNEEIEKLIKSKIGEETFNLLSDQKWDSRRNGFSQLSKIILANPEEYNSCIELFFKFIKIKLKDYKENNFNILKESFIVYEVLVEHCTNFSRKFSNIIIKNFSEKIGDLKLKQNISNLLLKIIEFQGPKITTLNLLKHMTKNVKGVSSLKEFSFFLEKSIEEFGISSFPVKDLVDFSILLASNANPQLRNSATNLLCCIYKYIGQPIKKFLSEIKESTMTIINEEFAKITVISNLENQPKRELKGQAKIEEGGTVGGNKNVLDNLLPRTDITKKITLQILKELNEGKSQNKKETLTNLEKILNEANMRILPNGLQPLITCMKNNINDGNKSLVRLIIQFLMKLVESLGSASKQFSKQLIPGILNNLSDKQVFLREDAIKFLEKWSEFNGFETVLPLCNQYLVKDNFEVRSELLKIILKNKQALQNFDSKDMVDGIIGCILDKNLNIRNLAEETAKEMLKYTSITNFYKSLINYKPEIAATVKSIIDKYGNNFIKQGSEQINFKTTGINNNVNLIDANINIQTNLLTNISINNPTGTSNLNLIRNNVKIIKGNEINIQQKNNENNNPLENNFKKQTNINNTVENNVTNIIKQNNSSNQMLNLKPIKINEINNEKIEPNIIQINPINPVFFITINVKPFQKSRRINSENKMIFPEEFLSLEYSQSLKELFYKAIPKNYADNAFSKDVTKLNGLFMKLNSVINSEIFLFNENSDLFLKLILIRGVEFKDNLFFDNIFFDFLGNLIKIIKDDGIILEVLENKIIVEILINKFISINNSKVKAEKYFEEFINFIDQNIVLDIFLNNLTKKNENNSIIKVYLEKLNNFLMIKINKLNLNKVNFENLNILIKIILFNCYEDTNKTQSHKILNDIYNNFSDEFKFNFGKFLENSNIELTLIISNPKLPDKFVYKNNIANNLDQNMNISFNKNANLDVENKKEEIKNNIIDKKNNDNLTIIKNEEILNIQKDENFILNFDPKFQKKIEDILKTISIGNLNEKAINLLELNTILFPKSEDMSFYLEKNLNSIIETLLDLLNLIFNQNLIEQCYDNLLKSLLVCFFNCFFKKEILEKLELKTTFKIFEEILKAILKDNLDKLGENGEGGTIIKSLNSLLLKFMENNNNTNSLIALLELLKIYRINQSKLFSLSVKCILKITNILNSIINKIEIDKVLFTMYELLEDMDKSNMQNKINQNDELCIKINRTILNEIIKLINEDIWSYYKKAIENKGLSDKFIKKWIQMILRSKNGISCPSNQKLLMTPNCNFVEMMNSNSKKPEFQGFSAISNKSIVPSNDLKYYVEKFLSIGLEVMNNKENIQQKEKEKYSYEIIAVLKRERLNLETIKNSLPEKEYDYLQRIYHEIISSSENTKKLDNNSKGIMVTKISDFENLFNKDNNSSKNIINNTIQNPTRNIPHFSENNTLNECDVNAVQQNNFVGIKSLQDYRNKIHNVGYLNRNADNYRTSRFETNNTSLSPIKSSENYMLKNNLNDQNIQIENDDKFTNNFNENKSNYSENFIRRESLNDLRYNNGQQNNMNLVNNSSNEFNGMSYKTNSQPGNNTISVASKIEDMKKRLFNMRNNTNNTSMEKNN